MKKMIMIIMLMLLALPNMAVADRYVQWDGVQWWVRSGTGDYNHWSDSNNSVWIDANNHLHMTISKSGNTWYATEFDTVNNTYYYGNYVWKVESPILSFDPNIINAMFWRYNDRNELDIECSQWGDKTLDRLWYSVQPTDQGGFITPNSPYACATNVTYAFDWEKTYVHFTATLANGTVIADYNNTNAKIIPHKQGSIAMQMWLMNHKTPSNGKNAEMVIDSFSYKPSSKGISFKLPRFPPTHNEVGGFTPRSWYSCFCFSSISPTRSDLPAVRSIQ